MFINGNNTRRIGGRDSAQSSPETGTVFKPADFEVKKGDVIRFDNVGRAILEGAWGNP